MKILVLFAVFAVFTYLTGITMEDRRYFNIDGIRVTLAGDIPIAKKAVHQARLLMLKTQLMNTENLEQVSNKTVLENGTEIKVSINHGIQKAFILAPGRLPKGKEKQAEPKFMEIPKYCLLAETRDGKVVIFATVAGEGNGKLVPVGVVPIAGDSHDPPGIIGQETWREGWVSQGFSMLKTGVGIEGSFWIEQLKRVDQSYLSYDGDSTEEETTEIWSYNYYTTWEDIEYTTHWESVDPGPPPEAMCGYSWAIPTNYGGPGGGDYSNIQHLFWYAVAGDTIVAWWPPEFNQKLVATSRANYNSCCYKAADAYDDAWYDMGDLNPQQCAGHLLFPGTFTQSRITQDVSGRYWGILWGNETFTCDDFGTSDDFPYTDYALRKNYDVVARSGHHKHYLLGGIYVYGAPHVFWIQGLIRRYGTWSYASRLAIDKRVDGSEAYYNLPTESLDERQLEIYKGNEFLGLAWVRNYFTGIWEYTEIEETEVAGDVYINCGGQEYFVFTEPGYYNYGNARANFSDYGIFTKPGTGVDTENLVTPDTIDPVYAYCADRYDTKDSTSIYFGLVIDGINYVSDPIPDDANNDFFIEIGDNAYELSCLVRAGVFGRVFKEGI